MREDAKGSTNNLHWHDGGTCHGSPTYKECAEEVVRHGWVGKVLETIDKYADGSSVRCYSLVASNFSHWQAHGRYVAEVFVSWKTIGDDY